MDISSGNGTVTTTVGLVGLGYWGPNLLRVLSEMPEVDVKWICDLDEDRLRTYVRRAPGTVGTTQVDEIFADPDVEAVLIATPVYTHFDLAARALEAGKHVFVEKPLAPSTELADRLVDIAETRDLRLMCGHTFLYSPPVRAIEDMIRRRELGNVYFVSSSRVNLGLHQTDVSVVWDLGPHDFSILLHWLKEVPRSVRAVGRDSIVTGIPDVAFVTLEFPSGIVANVELSWLAPSKLRRTVLVGSDKMVVYEDGSPEPVRIFDHGVVYEDPETFGQYQLSYRTGDILSVKLPSYEPLGAELADFVRAVQTGASLESMTALGRDVVRICEAADASLRSGGEEVRLATRRFSRLRSVVADGTADDADLA